MLLRRYRLNSDRGIQYTSAEFLTLIADLDMRSSMGRTKTVRSYDYDLLTFCRWLVTVGCRLDQYALATINLRLAAVTGLFPFAAMGGRRRRI